MFKNNLLETEVWRNIKGYYGIYQVSNNGCVRSLNRSVIHKKTGVQNRKGKLLKQYKNDRGYFCVYLSRHSKRKKYRISRLVSQTFLYNSENLPEVNHKDGNKDNNNYLNLEWSTHSQNIKHAFDSGLMTTKGEANPQSKLTEKDVLKIRDLEGNKTRKEIALLFSITETYVGLIVRRVNWKHI
ncbi:MAG: HNH endonuclease [Methanosarcinales archaeon]|nr:HNH endonuclease [Methanosarcinales archaeon]